MYTHGKNPPLNPERLSGQTVSLANGMTVHAFQRDVPFTLLEIIIPIGHQHNTVDILPGSLHFLEHLVFHRSERFPENNSFYKMLHLKGGDFDGSIGFFETSFTLRIRADLFVETLEQVIAHLYAPIFHDDDIAVERSIIANERKRKERWFPAGDELEQYLNTQWKNTVSVSLEQRLGSDTDHAAMTGAYLRHLHTLYFHPKTTILVGGMFDLGSVCEMFSRIPTHPETTLPISYQRASWVRQEYHEKQFRDVSRHIYQIGGIIPEVNLPLSIGLGFFFRLLTNPVNGPLYQWLREEKGWTYNIGYDLSVNQNEILWDLWFPMHEPGHVAAIRTELRERIEACLADQSLIEQTVDMYASQDIFMFQTVGSVVSEVSSLLSNYGRLYTESEERALFLKCNEPGYIRDMYTRWCSTDQVGEFLALPE